MRATAAPSRDLAMGDIPAGRALACLAAGLVCLAVLAMAATAGAQGRLRQLALEPRILTVAVPVGAAGAPAALVERLRQLPGLRHLRAVPREELLPLMPEGTDSRAALAGVPLPQLYDLAFEPDQAPDRAELARSLEALAPGVAVAEAATDPAAAAAVARRTRLLGWIGGGLALAGLLLGVGMVARWALEAQRESVQLLRALGAGEAHVARQFEQHAARTGLAGALIGFIAALALLALLGVAGEIWPLAGLVEPRLTPADWLRLTAVPVAAALLAAVVARLSIRVGLARLR